MDQVSRIGAGVSSDYGLPPAATDGSQPTVPVSGEDTPQREPVTPASSEQSGLDGAGGFQFRSTESEPPKVFPPVARIAREDPWQYVQALCHDVFRGLAWRILPKDGEQRWGLVDVAGHTYGEHARRGFAQFLKTELERVRIPSLHVSVSAFPGNGIRVVVHSGETEFYDSVFRFQNAKVIS